MNLVDSSGWLEYIAGGPNDSFFAPAIEDTNRLIVPAICLYEVYKRIILQRGQNEATKRIGAMLHGTVVPIDTALALEAARLSVETKLAMADSLIWATARLYNATLWTQDQHFKNLPGVRYIEKS
jgi:predicted nucleic acid-binding protein